MKKHLAVCLAVALLCAALCGCGAKSAPEATAAPTQTAAPTPSPKPTPTPEPTVTPAPTPDLPTPGEIPGLGGRPAASGSDLDAWEQHIDSVEALLDAISPYADLVLAPGDYDLTLTMDDEAITEFNHSHSCVKLNKVYDGIEIVIRDCAGLTIRGDDVGSAEVCLTVEPRYATVLSFENCTGLTISHLTMGHSPERGECEGSVVYLRKCSDVMLDNVDLYGCGAYGIETSACTGSVSVRNSIVRECEFGPVYFHNSPCEFLFVGCALIDSDGGGIYEGEEGSSLHFINCEFGTEETIVWQDRTDAQFDGCIFGVTPRFPSP